MVRFRHTFLFLALILTFSTLVGLTYSTDLENRISTIPQYVHTSIQAENNGLKIWAWDISGSANQSLPFIAWANVTDDIVGVRNVTVQVSAPNYTLVEELSYNGTFYEGQMEPLVFPGDYYLQVRAYNMNNQSLTGRRILVIITSPQDVTVDENLTMPAVVASSLLLALIVILAAAMYDKRSDSS